MARPLCCQGNLSINKTSVNKTSAHGISSVEGVGQYPMRSGSSLANSLNGQRVSVRDSIHNLA